MANVAGRTRRASRGSASTTQSDPPNGRQAPTLARCGVHRLAPPRLAQFVVTVRPCRAIPFTEISLLFARPAQQLAPLLVVLTVLLGSLPSSASAQAQQTDQRFGAVQAISSPDKAAQAGVRWERIIFPWSEMQPNSPDQLLQGYYSDAQ